MAQTQGCTDLLTPLDLSRQQNLSYLPNLNYSAQDYSSFKTRLAQYLAEQQSDKFSNFVEGDLLIVLMELWSFLADLLSFKMDQIANEVFIDTVTEVDNAFRLSQLVGFYPQPPIAARTFFSATMQQTLPIDLNLGNAIPLDVPAPDGTLTFELFPADFLNNPILEGDVIITAGNFSNTNIVGLEGRTQVDTNTALGGSNQSYQLLQFPVLYDSIRIDVDGVRWDQVQYFTDSNPRNEYRVEFDSSYRAFIMFGDGKAGRAPVQGSTIQVTYRVGGGVRGNILAGAIVSQRGYVVPGLNFPSPVTFRNYTRGEFGYNGDGIDDIRRKLPAYLKTQDRAVSGEDYETLAGQFVSPYNGQSAKAVAALRNYGCAGNVVDIYVLVKDGEQSVQTASDEFKVELSNYLDTRKMFTDQVCIRDGVVLEVDVTVDAIVDRFYQKFRDEILSNIQNQIAGFFSLNNWDFGEDLRDADLIKAISSISNITTASVSFSTNDPDNEGSSVNAQYYELIRQDQVNINLIFE